MTGRKGDGSARQSPVRLMGKTVCPALRSLSATGFQHHAPHHDPGTRTKAGFRPKSVSVVSIADLPVEVRFAFEKMYQERSSGQLVFPEKRGGAVYCHLAGLMLCSLSRAYARIFCGAFLFSASFRPRFLVRWGFMNSTMCTALLTLLHDAFRRLQCCAVWRCLSTKWSP